mmetsp:Transcript_3277/g.6458  ORF Transcript_3277/g.6458 Transcript_3277/m.6458 type:complete len:206 (+) Transcript_3277:769-1386(+)
MGMTNSMGLIIVRRYVIDSLEKPLSCSLRKNAASVHANPAFQVNRTSSSSLTLGNFTTSNICWYTLHALASSPYGAAAFAAPPFARCAFATFLSVTVALMGDFFEPPLSALSNSGEATEITQGGGPVSRTDTARTRVTTTKIAAQHCRNAGKVINWFEAMKKYRVDATSTPIDWPTELHVDAHPVFFSMVKAQPSTAMSCVAARK